MMQCTSLQLFGALGWLSATALMLIVVFLSVWSLDFRDNAKSKLTDLFERVFRRKR